MRSHSRTVLGLLALVAVGRGHAAHAGIVFRGDLETGNLTQFAGGPNQAAMRIAMAPAAPVREGRYSARAEVQNTNTWPNGLRRVELGYTPTEASFPNSERYYSFSVITSTDLPLVAGVTNSIGYWEAYPDFHQIMVFNVTDSVVTFTGRYPRPGSTAPAGDLWSAPFEAARWHDLVLHVKWSADPTIGFVEIWYDGVHALPRTPMQTMFRDTAGRAYANFFHTGLLHGDFDTMPQAVYVDRVLDGTTLADVLLPAPDGGARDASVADGAHDADVATAVDATVDATDATDATDALVARPDGGATPDVAVLTDATRSDAANRGEYTGCACRAARGGSPREGTPRALAAALALAGAIIARRRRRAASA